MYQVLQSMEGNSILSMDVTTSQITNLKAPGHLIIIRSPTMLTFHKSQIFLSTSTQSDTDMTMYIGFCRYDNHGMVWYDSNLANIIFAGEAKKFRIANNSTSTDLSIRAVHSDGSASGFTATSQGIALQKFPVNDSASNILKINFLHTTTAANGTSTTTATLTPGLVNYAYRKLIAMCNGGANGGRSIVSAIPTSANTVTINWDGNTPASGDIQISLMYWE